MLRPLSGKQPVVTGPGEYWCLLSARAQNTTRHKKFIKSDFSPKKKKRKEKMCTDSNPQ